MDKRAINVIKLMYIRGIAVASLAIGEWSPERFETGKDERLRNLGGEMNIRSIYSWFSRQADGNASVYPSRLHAMSKDERTGLLAVRFAILSANLEIIRVTNSLFDRTGLYRGQKNNNPFMKYEAGGPVAVEDGYFIGPVDIDMSQFTHGTHGPKQPLKINS